MDKESIKLSIKRVFTDRPFLMLMATLAATGFLYCVVVGLNIHRSDVTVYTRYSAFGEAHFYKDPWQYLFTFVAFGLVATVGHLAIMVKLHNMERRQTAILVGWIGIGILLVALAYTLAVMSLGRAT